MVDSKFDVSIIDYGVSNLFSVKRACDQVNLKSIITDDENIILNSSSAILPGVGAFPYAMEKIKEKKIDRVISEFIETNKPFLGICLGMQLLMDESEEFEKTKGLGFIKGTTKKLNFSKDEENIFSVPQIGWNKIKKKNDWTKSLMNNIRDNSFMYFVHSYYVAPNDKSIILTETKYGSKYYCSSFQKGNIFATQFHPEKSGNEGLKIYSSLKSKINK